MRTEMSHFNDTEQLKEGKVLNQRASQEHCSDIWVWGQLWKRCTECRKSPVREKRRCVFSRLRLRAPSRGLQVGFGVFSFHLLCGCMQLLSKWHLTLIFKLGREVETLVIVQRRAAPRQMWVQMGEFSSKDLVLCYDFMSHLNKSNLYDLASVRKSWHTHTHTHAHTYIHTQSVFHSHVLKTTCWDFKCVQSVSAPPPLLDFAFKKLGTQDSHRDAWDSDVKWHCVCRLVKQTFGIQIVVDGV